MQEQKDYLYNWDCGTDHSQYGATGEKPEGLGGCSKCRQFLLDGMDADQYEQTFEEWARHRWTRIKELMNDEEALMDFVMQGMPFSLHETLVWYGQIGLTVEECREVMEAHIEMVKQATRSAIQKEMTHREACGGCAGEVLV